MLEPKNRITSAKTTQKIIIAILDLAEAAKATPIEGCWERQINDTWYLAVNGSEAPVKVRPSDTAMAHTLQPGSMAAWYGDWIAGELAFDGGWFAAHCEGASPRTFVEAIEMEIKSKEANEDVIVKAK